MFKWLRSVASSMRAVYRGVTSADRFVAACVLAMLIASGSAPHVFLACDARVGRVAELEKVLATGADVVTMTTDPWGRPWHVVHDSNGRPWVVSAGQDGVLQSPVRIAGEDSMAGDDLSPREFAADRPPPEGAWFLWVYRNGRTWLLWAALVLGSGYMVRRQSARPFASVSRVEIGRSMLAVTAIVSVLVTILSLHPIWRMTNAAGEFSYPLASGVLKWLEATLLVHPLVGIGGSVWILFMMMILLVRRRTYSKLLTEE